MIHNACAECHNLESVILKAITLNVFNAKSRY